MSYLPYETEEISGSGYFLLYKSPIYVLLMKNKMCAASSTPQRKQAVMSYVAVWSIISS